MAPGDPDSVVVDFLATLLADREAGRARPLREYLARFPGHEESIAREYLRRQPTALADEAPPADDGEEFVGPYHLERELGRGGQGSVWLAEDTRLGRKVALKLVPRSPLAAEMAPRFEREARAASRLDHPGICSVYDVGSDGGVSWIAMRYVPGETLAQALATVPIMEVGRATLLFEKAARALHAAHEAGIVHRDVKPGNLMVTPDDEPVLLDFGVAKESGDGPPLTLTGDALGTPAYMSPQQVTGGRVDERTDVWSLGATFYEALTGGRPFESPTREGLLRAILRQEPDSARTRNPAIPRDLDVILATALTKEIDQRYQTALDLAEDLGRLREGRPIRARPAGIGTRLARWARRNPGLAASLGATFLVMTVALAVTASLLAETRAALEANAALLDEVTQLADAKVARDMLAEEKGLWPAHPERTDDMRKWLRRARDLEARLEGHHRVLESVDVRLASASAERLASSADVETDAWVQEQLGQIIEGIEALVEVIPQVEQRMELSDSIRRRTIDEQRDAWNAAVERVRGGGVYGGLDLTPQLGLIPLGPDPASGLEEFAHLASGEPVARGPDGGLAMTEEHGMVLVLIPGGTVDLGSEVDTDRHSARWDGPVHRVRLDPYFISKYEMTVAQWQRHTRDVPCAYSVGSPFAHPERPLMQPAEQVIWDVGIEALQQLGLTLPTGAQWERAARAGTTTPWYTGSERESLAGHVNLADSHARAHDGPDGWSYEMWLDDGATSPVPVGTYAANPYGLHDMAGNVREWCLSSWEDLALYTPRDGDGLLEGEIEARVIRGGSFSQSSIKARHAYRDGMPRHAYAPDLGVRAARSLD